MDLTSLGCIVFGWFSALSGVALGGFLVFKTKREPYESLWTKNPQGEAINLMDGLPDEIDSFTEDLKEGPLAIVAEQNERLKKEMQG